MDNKTSWHQVLLGGAVRRTTLSGAAVWHGLTEGLSTLCISMPTWLRIFRECPQ